MFRELFIEKHGSGWSELPCAIQGYLKCLFGGVPGKNSPGANRDNREEVLCRKPLLSPIPPVKFRANDGQGTFRLVDALPADAARATRTSLTMQKQRSSTALASRTSF